MAANNSVWLPSRNATVAHAIGKNDQTACGMDMRPGDVPKGIVINADRLSPTAVTRCTRCANKLK